MKVFDSLHLAFLRHLVFDGQNTGTHLYFGVCGIEAHFSPQGTPPAEAVHTKVKRRRTAKNRADFMAIEVNVRPDPVRNS
ncbi:hypothetical protein BWQ96_07386 [Gracilariopsis chorda]|uniref:Uncharacterized protein n=1 Tax=Gracilariopsis chorda TaxID=448386 RepID=A0A2V3ILE8_9FLOR|nr:hypothetical protein BWQ96_07386 [Gracilariopsis chorda]|eukprot:PXF42878.1 hypothetical protein BWQ96_07386 [Gracilariopsis chorda]